MKYILVLQFLLLCNLCNSQIIKKGLDEHSLFRIRLNEIVMLSDKSIPNISPDKSKYYGVLEISKSIIELRIYESKGRRLLSTLKTSDKLCYEFIEEKSRTTEKIKSCNEKFEVIIQKSDFTSPFVSVNISKQFHYVYVLTGEITEANAIFID